MASTRKIALTLTIFICLMILVPKVNSEEVSTLQKKQLFYKIIRLTNVQERYNQMIDIMCSQMKMTFRAQLQDVIRKMEDKTTDQKADFTIIMEGSTSNMLLKMRDTLKQEMPFSKVVDQVYYPLYDKHFSESDLQAIVTFYENPVIRKFVSFNPDLLHEVSKLDELSAKKIQKAYMAIAVEEFKRISPVMRHLDKK